jgi:streptogrisin C
MTMSGIRPKFLWLGVALTIASTTAFAPAQDAPTGYIGSSGVEVRVPSSEAPAVPESLRDAFAALDLLTEANPDDLGYVSVDDDGDGLVIGIPATAGQALVDDALRGVAPSPVAKIAGDETSAKMQEELQQGLGLLKTAKVARKPAGLSRRETESIKDAAIELSNNAELRTAGIWQTRVDRVTGKVIVTAEQATDTLTDELARTFGAANVVVEVERNPQESNVAGRQSDSSPFFGGAGINGPTGSCSTAFAWTISSTTSGMLSAGHCFPNGGAASTPSMTMGTVTSGSRENYSSAGTVYFTNQTTYRGDLALISIYSGKTSAAKIYRGSATSSTNSTVTGKMSRRALPGDQFCTGGMKSGEICGWSVKDTQVNQTVTGGAISRNVVRSNSRQGWCARPGDSGGSVFITSSSNVIAKGVMNFASGGGSDYYGGALDKCSMGFTDIWDAYYGLPGDIKH